MKRLMRMGLGMMAVLGMMSVAVVGSGGQVWADEFNPICSDGSVSQELKKEAGCNEKGSLTKTGTNLISVAIGLVGLAAVVVIIFGGFTYATSAGDAGKIKKAKDTILYGVVGLVVASLAYAIVNFVLKNVFK